MSIETVSDIQEALNTMATAMADKGIVGPAPRFEIDQGRYGIWLHADSLIGGEACHIFRGDTIDNVFASAIKLIESLPSAEDRATREYLRKIAHAVDYAKAEGIDDDYVAPLRDVSCAMTENLLTSEVQS